MPRDVFDIILELFPEYNFTVDLPEDVSETILNIETGESVVYTVIDEDGARGNYQARFAERTPYRVDLKPYIENGYPPYLFTIIRADEITDSIRATEGHTITDEERVELLASVPNIPEELLISDPTLPTLVDNFSSLYSRYWIDEDGFLNYLPEGDFFNNRLQMRIRVQSSFPITAAATDSDRDETEEDEEPEPTMTIVRIEGPYVILGEEEDNLPELTEQEVNVNITTSDGSVYIGQPLALSELWVSQGMSGVCQLGTALGIINKQRVDAGLPPLTLEELTDIATTINIRNPEPFRNPDGKLIPANEGVPLWDREATNKGYGFDPQGPNVPGGLEGLPNFGPSVTITALLDHFGIPSHTGRIHSIDVLIDQLLEGNPVMVGVDSDEFRRKLDGNPLGNTKYNDLTSDDPLRTELDHAVLATGIRIDVETGEIFIIFNESGSFGGAGAGVELTLEDAVAALDDGNFAYVGVGEEPNNPELQQLYAERDAWLIEAASEGKDITELDGVPPNILEIHEEIESGKPARKAALLSKLRDAFPDGDIPLDLLDTFDFTPQELINIKAYKNGHKDPRTDPDSVSYDPTKDPNSPEYLSYQDPSQPDYDPRRDPNSFAYDSRLDSDSVDYDPAIDSFSDQYDPRKDRFNIEYDERYDKYDPHYDERRDPSNERYAPKFDFSNDEYDPDYTPLRDENHPDYDPRFDPNNPSYDPSYDPRRNRFGEYYDPTLDDDDYDARLDELSSDYNPGYSELVQLEGNVLSTIRRNRQLFKKIIPPGLTQEEYDQHVAIEVSKSDPTFAEMYNSYINFKAIYGDEDAGTPEDSNRIQSDQYQDSYDRYKYVSLENLNDFLEDSDVYGLSDTDKQAIEDLIKLKEKD